MHERYTKKKTYRKSNFSPQDEWVFLNLEFQLVFLGRWLPTEKISVYGPPAPEDEPGPVKWTAPYFDCGGSNKWVVSAVSPIVDLYPR